MPGIDPDWDRVIVGSMDPLADCLTALNFWNVIGGPKNEMVAKRELWRYLNAAGSDYAAQKDALDKLAAAWVQTAKPTDPVTVTEYLIHSIRASAPNGQPPLVDQI